MSATLSLLFLLVMAAGADAQTIPNSKRWDVSANTGVFVGHPADPLDSEVFDDWYHSATLSLAAGRYLTPHVKVEGEVTLSREGSRYGIRIAQVPDIGSHPISTQHLTRTHGVSGAVVWQFFDNQWIHPFLLAGATLDFDRQGSHTWQQSSLRADPGSGPSEMLLTTERTEYLGTTRAVRGLLGGGAKVYVSPHAFFRVDSRVGIGSASTGHVAFRFGAGVDF